MERHPLGPFPAEWMNQSLSQAIGSGRIRPALQAIEPTECEREVALGFCGAVCTGPLLVSQHHNVGLRSKR